MKLEQEQFSGVCTLSSHGGNGVLVYRNGKCILARVMTKYGDAGLEELQKFLDQNGDAALSVLDETQIKLALEFNKPAIVKKHGPVTMMPPRKSYPSPHIPWRCEISCGERIAYRNRNGHYQASYSQDQGCPPGSYNSPGSSSPYKETSFAETRKKRVRGG